jgi:NAD(P)-dependent dehydrogenase (short-subunit alcohol dehydrogenase family)
VIANAGVSRVAAFHKTTLAEVDDLMAVNLRGALEVVHAALPSLRDQRGGRVLLTTSSTALYGDAGFVAYAAAKSGVIGFVAALARECVRAGIGVNAVLPFAHTPMTDALFAGDAFPAGSADVLGPGPVASLAAWLVSESCSRTGEVWVAGGPVVRRAAVVVSRGVDLTGEVTPEAIAAQADAIADLTGAQTYPSGEALLDDIARRALRLGPEPTPRR